LGLGNDQRELLSIAKVCTNEMKNLAQHGANNYPVEKVKKLTVQAF
jgi:hypothetical protein